MSFLVWLAAYLLMAFGVIYPAFAPEGFLETFAMIALSWVFASFVQGVFDALTGRS